MSSASNLSFSQSEQPYLWSRTVVRSLLLMTVVALWAGCVERAFTPADGGYALVGLVRDKETLEPLNKALLGFKRPEIPDSAFIDSSAFMTFVMSGDSVDVIPNLNVMMGITATREDGYFALCGSMSIYGDSKCVKENISRLIAWKSGYKFWKYNARRDTISRLDNDRVHINIYLEKINNQ